MATALSSLRQSVGRLMGSGDQAMITGTPTGTYTTTGFAASGLAAYETSYFVDWWLRFHAGTHKDISREVTAFTTSTGLFVFTGAVTGAIDGTDLFELWRDFTPEEVNSAINLAISMIEKEALVDKVDESLVVNDLLTDGLMETWTDSSNLTNWTTGGTGTLAREATIKVEGTYSAKMTNTVSNAFTLSQSISNYPFYSSRTATLSARIHCNTADRVRIRLTDGVNTWNSDYHDGNGWRSGETTPSLKIDSVTIDSTPTELTASVRIESGAAITCYVDKMYLVSGDTIYEYTMPSGFHTLDRVIVEDGIIGRFPVSKLIDARGWQILGTSTKKLVFDPKYSKLKDGRKLRLEGQAIPGQLSLDADTTAVNAAYIIYQAAALLHQSRIVGNEGPSTKHDLQMKLAQAMADRERANLFIMPRGRLV